MPTFRPSGQTGMIPEWGRRILMSAPYIGLPYTAARIGGAIYRGLSNPYSAGADRLNAMQQQADPSQQQQPPQAAPQAPAGTGVHGSVNSGGLMNSTQYNAYRPAFSPSYQQMAFPGSAIGPTSGATRPYDPSGATGIRTGSFLMGSNARPNWAANNYAEIMKRNQI